MQSVKADSTGNKEAIVLKDVGEEEVPLKVRIEELWEKKEAESRTVAEGRNMRSNEDRERDALNWAFDRLPVSFFPKVPQVIELRSDTGVEEALEILAHHHIFSAPVRNVNAPDDASWMDRYLGMVDFSSIVLTVLNLAEVAAAGITVGTTAVGTVTGTALAGLGALAIGATGGLAGIGLVAGASAGAALTAGAMSAGPGKSGLALTSFLGGDFFKSIKESGIVKEIKVSDIAGTFRWGPFLPVQLDDSLLTLFLLLSKYRVKSVPVVVSGEPQVKNIITQTVVIDLLAGCSGLDWFDHVADQSLEKLGLPVMTPEQVIKVEDDRPILEPFQKMAEKNIGGVAVVAKGSNELVANISTRDIRFLIQNPKLFKKESLTVKDFIEGVMAPHGKFDDPRPVIAPPITCTSQESLKDVIQRLSASRIHRIYVTEGSNTLKGVVTLRDIISKFVYEPKGYFGDFFGAVKKPQTEAPQTDAP